MKNQIIEKLYYAAEHFPEKQAFAEHGGSALTFRALLTRARSIAYAISTRTSSADDRPVAIMADRSPDCIAALLGAVIAGRWYVMIDAELPAERTAAMLDICSPCTVISGSGDNNEFLSLHGYYPPAPEGFLIPERDGKLPLFGIFTSGSTGIPKLVVKSRDAMCSFIDVYCRTFGFTNNDIFGNQIPFYFDASTKDIFSTLWLGASCVTIPSSAFAFPVNLVSILNEHMISAIVWVPSALSIAARFNVFSAALPKHLRIVLFVGEQMPVKYLNVWRRALPATKFVNLYGSTEVAGNSCYYIVERDFKDADTLPIGKPFEGTSVFIINPENGEQASEGEICVAGPGLAIGYYKDPEKTSIAFREEDIGNFRGRLYFSGDFGRVDPEYGFVCVSRKDSQIKHMGHRIELGDIESAALALPYVHEACCLYSAEQEKIVLFFSSEEDVSRNLRRDLAAALPKYMIPHKIKYLDSLPHNRNGKTDRAALKRSVDEVLGERRA